MLLKLASDVTNVDLFEIIKKVEKYESLITGNIIHATISKENWHGPRNAIEQLITTSQWSNVYLSNTERKIVNEYNTTSTKDGHSFLEVFSYSNYATRFLTLAEVTKTDILYS